MAPSKLSVWRISGRSRSSAGVKPVQRQNFGSAPRTRSAWTATVVGSGSQAFEEVPAAAAAPAEAPARGGQAAAGERLPPGQPCHGESTVLERMASLSLLYPACELEQALLENHGRFADVGQGLAAPREDARVPGEWALEAASLLGALGARRV